MKKKFLKSILSLCTVQIVNLASRTVQKGLNNFTSAIGPRVRKILGQSKILGTQWIG